jgi:hypothetical protein
LQKKASKWKKIHRPNDRQKVKRERERELDKLRKGWMDRARCYHLFTYVIFVIL